MSSVSALNSLLSSGSTPSASSSIDISSLLAAATGATSTGIDVTSAVDAAIYAAQAPERQWQAQQATLQSQMSALTSIQTALASVSSDLNTLNDPTGALSARSVTSSNSSAVTATAASGTSVGSHIVAVNSLATSASWYSTPLASADAALGSSTLTISQSNGTNTSFALGGSGSNSLSSLVSAINSSGIGVKASIVMDADGSRLALVGQTSGSSADFTVNDGSSPASPAWASADVASASTKLAASSFQVSDGSSSATISVLAGSTLADVANQINSNNLNLSATVVQDSSGAHLSIQENGSGNVSVSSDPALFLTRASSAANASLTVDGIPVNSSSNTVTGAIDGLTLNLQSITSSPVTLGVSPDASQISSALSQFVTDYNSATSFVNAQFTFSTTSGSQGVLGSDASVRSLQSTLLGTAGYTAPASSTSTSTSINTLADLGITMNNDGSLSLDATKLNQAIATNATGVQQFFQGTALNGFASTVTSGLKAFADPANGALAADMNSMSQQYSSLQTSVNNYESGYIASQRTVLTTMYSNAEIALQQLPTTLKQLQAQLSNNSSGG